MADDSTKFHIDGKTYDLDDFTLGELEWIEDYIGHPITGEASLMGIRAAVGLVYIVKRRDDDAFSIEDARHLKVSVLEGEDESAEPKRAAKRRPTKPAAR